jgi:hypothetical protein
MPDQSFTFRSAEYSRFVRIYNITMQKVAMRRINGLRLLIRAQYLSGF